MQILDIKFITWLDPYIKKYKFAPGDYLFPAFARLMNAPSARWQQIMERAKCPMHYENGICQTGYQALRISLDQWVKDQEEVLLSEEDIKESMLRHSGPVHDKSYDSGAVNRAQQKRINAARPTFEGGGSDLVMMLAEVREQKRNYLTTLNSIIQRETELMELIQMKQEKADGDKANHTGSAGAN
jgi:hypothetical protein